MAFYDLKVCLGDNNNIEILNVGDLIKIMSGIWIVVSHQRNTSVQQSKLLCLNDECKIVAFTFTTKTWKLELL